MEPRFIADMMLGKLARWMNLLGYDIIYSREISDGDLVQLAREQERIILTRDTRLSERKPEKLFLIHSTNLWEQLAQVVQAYPADFRDIAFSRCTHCNVAVVPVEKGEVEHRLPPRVRERQAKIYQCPQCQQLYWHATHVKHVTRRLKEKLGITLSLDDEE
jgi:uncharacterized protein with PIN domain